jgi:ligand-binding sensor domain-containing protein
LNDGAFAALTNVTALAPGAGSTIWAAAQGRLFRLDLAHQDPSARLTTALQEVGAVSVMTIDRGGDLWIGRTDDDLLRYHPADGRVDRFPRATRYPLALFAGKGGELWIGARGGGLTRLDPATGRLIVYRHDPENPASLSSDDVPAIHEDALGGLWVGSWNGGVNRLDPLAQGFRTFRHRARVADSLPADDVTAMTETGDGSLWLASRSGIVGVGDPRTGRFRTAAVLSNGGRPVTRGQGDRGSSISRARASPSSIRARSASAGPRRGSSSPRSKSFIASSSRDGWSLIHRSIARSTRRAR